MEGPMATKSLPSQRKGSREAIVDAATRLFLQRGFGDVSMDDLAQAAGVARRTLYNQFASKEEILREMLSRVATDMGNALPPGIETEGDVENVLRRIATAILTFQAAPEFAGIIRMAIADAPRFPWIAGELEKVLKPYRDRFARYFSHLTSLGVLNCSNALLAAYQFLGLLNEPVLWPTVLGQESASVPLDRVIDEAVRMFLLTYRTPRPL